MNERLYFLAINIIIMVKKIYVYCAKRNVIWLSVNYASYNIARRYNYGTYKV